MAEDQGSKVAGSRGERERGLKLEPKPKARRVKAKAEPLLAASVQVYRAKLPLAKGQKIIARGAMTDLAWLDEAAIQRLIAVGAVRTVISPPLAELAGWQRRAKKMSPLGVITLADFLAVPVPQLAKVLRVKAKTVTGWQDQLRGWSEMETPPRR